jgi:hypothetical protein
MLLMSTKTMGSFGTQLMASSGKNPFAERSSKHSTWPVILTIYNLSLGLM